jgi:arylsulfatase A-like enzyme
MLRAKGIDTVMPGSWHFGRDGHSAFYRFMLDYIIVNKFI